MIDITWLDCVYIACIGLIIGALLVIESQIKELKTMMEEHIKCQDSFKIKKSSKVPYTN